MNSYTFPFNSCETPRNNSQPYSTTVTAIISMIVMYYFIVAKTFPSKLFFFSLLIFNIFHTLSHYVHIENLKNTQFLITHYAAIFSSFTLLYLFYKITNFVPPVYVSLLFILLYSFDTILAFFQFSHIWNIATFVIILLSICFCYYNHLNSAMQENLKWVAALTLLTLLIQILEINFCQLFLKNYPDIPFHLLVEISGGFAIYFLCKTFV